MTPNNLPKFIALEKVAQDVGHGEIAMDLHLQSGNIVGMTLKGTKRTIYNQSNHDVNTNEKAMKYLLERMKRQIDDKSSGIITFNVATHAGKVKTIDVESNHKIQ